MKKLENPADKAVSKEDMKLSELKELAVSLKLIDEAGAKALKKPALLKLIGNWESDQKKTLNTQDSASSGLHNVSVRKCLVEGCETTMIGPGDDAPVFCPDHNDHNTRVAQSKEPWALGYHEDKKIVAIVPVELNGKNYDDITTEDGVTYRVLKA